MTSELLKAAIEALKTDDAPKALEILEQLIAEAAGAAPDESTTETPAELSSETTALVAAARMAMDLSGKQTPGEAIAELSRRSALAIDLETREARLSQDRATLEAGERDALVVELVTKAGESPGTAWADPEVATDRAKRKPAEPWASMPIAALRSRVAKLSKDPKPKPKPPPGSETDADGLTEREIEMCKRSNLDPAKYAATRAKIRGRSQQTA